jgi:protoporphyrinogen oxidase
VTHDVVSPQASAPGSPHVGVLGGGALGLAAAYRLTRAGARVTVIEKAEVVGGLASSFPVGGGYLEKFYHHLFRSDRVITDLIHEVGLGSKLIWRSPVTASLVDGAVYRMDPLRLLAFRPLSPIDRLRLFAGMAYLKLQRDYHALEGKAAADWIKRRMGPATYAKVWEPLLVSKFGEHAERIAMPWLWSRIYCRSLSLGYLRGGFHQLYVTLDQRIAAAGGVVRTGQSVERIEAAADGRVRVVADGAAQEFDRVICTLPTRLFMQLTRGLPEDYRTRYDWGDYHGAHCVILSLDRPLSQVYWLSVHDPGYPFLVAVEHTNYLPAEDYGGQHLLYLGNYLPMSDPRFRLSDQELLDAYLPHLSRLNPSFDRSWVKDAWVFKAPFAQPIVTVDYHRHLPPHETPIPNLFLANMFQVYPQDRGQNYSIQMADRVVDLALRGSTAPIAAVG